MQIYANNIKRAEIDLTLSENPLGCSPLVLKAARNLCAKDLSCYPNTTNLIRTLAQKLKVKESNIVLGAGSESLIRLISQTFLNPDDLVLVQSGSFPLFTTEPMALGASVKQATLTNFLDSESAQLCFFCNPNNPTGELIPKETLSFVIRVLQKSLIVIDEANGEFIDFSFAKVAAVSQNIIVLKTLSKAIGLAGLRIGIAIGPEEIIKRLRANQLPFPISTVSCKLAEAALQDQEFIEKTKRFIAVERAFTKAELEKRGLAVSNSVTNNLFITCPFAKKLVEELDSQGVAVIPNTSFPNLKKPGFRISIKTRKINLSFLRKLDIALQNISERKNGKIKKS